MLRNTLSIFILLILCTPNLTSQNSHLAIKIGNNGNLSFNNKYYSGNYSEIQRWGNGYQGAISFRQDIAPILGIAIESSYVNSRVEIDHESYWPSAQIHAIDGLTNTFYEEISINNSAFNLAGNAVINLGRVRLGAGPEISYLVQSVGRGARYYASESIDGYDAHPVQYRFFSKRKQVYNLENPEELHAYKINRWLYGYNFNVAIDIFRSFSLEIKTFHNVTPYVEEFLGFNNLHINQRSINMQMSVVYTLPLHLQKQRKKKRRKYNNSNGQKRRFSSARLKKVEVRRN